MYFIHHLGGGYLYRRSNGSWDRTPHIWKAEQFTLEKATNVLNNCISISLRKNWEIVEVPVEASLLQPDKVYEVGEFDWEGISKDQYELFSALEQYGKQLKHHLSEVDLEICDIQHYIEFFNLDAAKGYKAYRMLKERLLRRRKIKDELAKTRIFLSGTAGDFSVGKIDQQVRAFRNRQYIPRVLNELFGIELDEKSFAGN